MTPSSLIVAHSTLLTRSHCDHLRSRCDSCTFSTRLYCALYALSAPKSRSLRFHYVLRAFTTCALRLRYAYTGWPRNNSRYSRFSGLCSNQQLFSSPCWIEHLFPIIITPRSLNLVVNFLFYETFLMDCHFRDLPDFQSFEAR